MYWPTMMSRVKANAALRIHIAGAHRVFYLATRPEDIYVLHAFEKKTQKTSAHDSHRRADALYSSNWSDSRQRFESGLCLGFANSLPLAVGAMVFEVCQIGVLRREQPVFLGLGLRP